MKHSTVYKCGDYVSAFTVNAFYTCHNLYFTVLAACIYLYFTIFAVCIFLYFTIRLKRISPVSSSPPDCPSNCSFPPVFHNCAKVLQYFTTVQYCTVLHSCTAALQYFTTAQYCTVLYCTVLYFTTVQFCTVLYCTVLYFTAVLLCSQLVSTMQLEDKPQNPLFLPC